MEAHCTVLSLGMEINQLILCFVASMRQSSMSAHGGPCAPQPNLGRRRYIPTPPLGASAWWFVCDTMTTQTEFCRPTIGPPSHCRHHGDQQQVRGENKRRGQGRMGRGATTPRKLRNDFDGAALLMVGELHQVCSAILGRCRDEPPRAPFFVSSCGMPSMPAYPQFSRPSMPLTCLARRWYCPKVRPILVRSEATSAARGGTGSLWAWLWASRAWAATSPLCVREGQWRLALGRWSD